MEKCRRLRVTIPEPSSSAVVHRRGRTDRDPIRVYPPTQEDPRTGDAEVDFSITTPISVEMSQCLAYRNFTMAHPDGEPKSSLDYNGNGD